MQRERACALPFLTAPAQVFAVVFETNIFNKDYRPVGIQRNTVGNLNSERRLLKFAADDIRTRTVGDKVEISIRDNGIGIKREDLKKIVDKFYRVSTGNRHDVKGFGLGLAYVHKIITDLKGDIRVESEINQGSTFIITLPLIKNK